MKIISWNINSLRLRLPLLRELIKQSNADVICLQETKVQDSDFPALEIKSMGYEFLSFSGEKSYNGVAIISRFPIKSSESIDILNYGHKRHIKATFETKIGEVDLHNFYVPAGGDIPDVDLNDKFDHKLKFIDWMTDYFATQKSRKIIIVGDINIAPLEHDVWSHKQLIKIVSHTPIEVQKLNNLQKQLNFIDTHRHFIDPSQKLYTWWSYRAKDPLGADKGRRLDHIWATPNLEKQIQDMKIYKDFRAAVQTSDHVPIQTNFNLL